MDKETICCATCPNWQRDGADGICYGSMPRPKIVEARNDARYALVWPRTQAHHRCPEHPETMNIFKQLQ